MLIQNRIEAQSKTGCFRSYLRRFCLLFLFQATTLSGTEIPEASIAKGTTEQTLVYYLNVSDFALSFIVIPTAPVVDGTTIQSTYLAGRAPIYNQDDIKAGTCSASFLCMQTADGIYTDISNYLSADNGLVVSWFTPTTLINLELDSIIHSMVTKCMVTASTAIGFNPLYGRTYTLIVSSEGGRIYFTFTRTGMIF